MIAPEDKTTLAKTTLEATAGLFVWHLSLQDWVAVVTILYVALQIGLLMPKYFRMFREWRKSIKKP